MRASIDSHALAGWQLLALRPASECATLRRLAARLGARLVCAAPWRIERRPLQGDALHRALRIAPWLVTSPNAVRAAAALVDLRRLPSPVLAVGPGTARALRRAGVSDVRYPQRAYESEGLLAMPELSAIAQAVLLTGVGGRGLIAKRLAERGVAVERIDVYSRVVRHWSPGALQRIQGLEAPAVLLLSSAEALLSGGAPLAAALRRLPVVAASGRIAEAATQSGLSVAAVADSAMPSAMLQALQHHAKRRPIR